MRPPARPRSKVPGGGLRNPSASAGNDPNPSTPSRNAERANNSPGRWLARWPPRIFESDLLAFINVFIVSVLILRVPTASNPLHQLSHLQTTAPRLRRILKRLLWRTRPSRVARQFWSNLSKAG